jgi:hypothetical protein
MPAMNSTSEANVSDMDYLDNRDHIGVGHDRPDNVITEEGLEQFLGDISINPPQIRAGKTYDSLFGGLPGLGAIIRNIVEMGL